MTVQSLMMRVQDSGFRVQGLGTRVRGVYRGFLNGGTPGSPSIDVLVLRLRKSQRFESP